jgi:Domain of unknown function (DUF4112)
MATQNDQQHNTTDPDLARLEGLAKLLDNQFRIPGTNFRFGLDGIIGLVPYVGDLAGLVVSGFLLRTMIRRGAGPILMLRMLGNYALDAIVGIVPFIGDLFDFGFKANRRNVAMLRQYYASGKKPVPAKWSIALLTILFLAGIGLLLWATWKAGAWMIGQLF